jgi:phage recombination protein Bet
MSTAAITQGLPTLKTFLSPEQREILRKSPLCAKLTSDWCDYFFEVVERTKLDPFTGQIRPDVRKAKEEDGTKVPTLIIITTLQGLRSIGDRSGHLDGESAPEWSDANGEWKDVWLYSDPPVAARASVYRKDRPRPQTAVVRWDAFVQLIYDKQGNLVPGPFWKKMGSHMLAKCALAAAYRGAFPNQCSGLYISEEIGDELDPDSEEAIEAEMIRRARDEKAYWDEERKKGNLPIDELQRSQGIFPRTLPDQSLRGAALVQQNAVPESHSALSPNEIKQGKGDWQFFTIRRVQLFQGRTVGSLTVGELEGLSSWMEKVEKAWANLDEDLKAHYKAIKGRMDYERDQMALADGLDFSK